MIWQEFCDFLKECLVGEANMPQPTPQPVPIPPPPKGDLLDTFCAGIKFREGANPANNNPGNCKFYDGGYLPIYGKVTKSVGGFAMFPTYEQGWLYLENLVRSKCHNHPDWTIQDFFNDYAPASDKNDPVDYARQVAARCGVPVTFKISGLLI